MGAPVEERFDRITRFANLLLGTPISLISLIDSDRQWFKSAQGLAVKETSRDDAFCAHTIIEQKTFFVEDATKEERFKDNPRVKGDPHIRMYAGHPIELENGLRIGTLCVIHRKPRALATRHDVSLQPRLFHQRAPGEDTRSGHWDCSFTAASGVTEKLVAKAVEALETGQRQGTDKIRYADTFEQKLQ